MMGVEAKESPPFGAHPSCSALRIAHHDFRESLLDEAKWQSLVPAVAFDPVGILNPGRMYPGI
jgi:hypothetical protein